VSVRWRTVAGPKVRQRTDTLATPEYRGGQKSLATVLVSWGVMSAYTSPQPSLHRIAILISPVGRFLECRDCLLSFNFPLGEHYDAVAMQFQAQSCRSSIPIPGRRIED
jgi:hypothetical protein